MIPMMTRVFRPQRARQHYDIKHKHHYSNSNYTAIILPKDYNNYTIKTIHMHVINVYCRTFTVVCTGCVPDLFI